MKRTNVLLQEGGCLLGQAVVSCLRQAGNYRIIVTDIDPESLGLMRADLGYLIPKQWNKYDKRIHEIVEKEHIDIIIPCHDISLSHLVRPSLKVPIIIDPKTVLIARDKYKTSEWLKDHSFLYPKTWKEPNEIEAFPVIVKPISGWGTKELYKANNEKELEIYFSLCQQNGFKPIIQEILKGKEYTNMVYISKDREILSSTVTSVEKRGGVSYRMTILKDGDLNREIETIAEQLKAIGPINMQGILTKEGFTIFELNARFSGTQDTRAYAGVNGPDLLIKNWLFNLKEYPKVTKSIKAFHCHLYYYIQEDKWKNRRERGQFGREGEIPIWL